MAVGTVFALSVLWYDGGWERVLAYIVIASAVVIGGIVQLIVMAVYRHPINNSE